MRRARIEIQPILEVYYVDLIIFIEKLLHFGTKHRFTVSNFVKVSTERIPLS